MTWRLTSPTIHDRPTFSAVWPSSPHSSVRGDATTQTNLRCAEMHSPSRGANRQLAVGFELSVDSEEPHGDFDADFAHRKTGIARVLERMVASPTNGEWQRLGLGGFSTRLRIQAGLTTSIWDSVNRPTDLRRECLYRKMWQRPLRPRQRSWGGERFHLREHEYDRRKDQAGARTGGATCSNLAKFRLPGEFG
jgi:hypothetical protein